MVLLVYKLAAPKKAATTLTLPWEKRIHSRLRVTLDNGQEAGLLLERGAVLRNGDLIASEDGVVVEVRASDETVSVVRCTSAEMMGRLCYHLGNRHVALEILSDEVHYLHDHVLDEMVRGLGLTVNISKAPFEPESGAYGGHSHTHEH